MINSEETIAEYIAAKRQVKRIVKQEKRNKGLSMQEFVTTIPKASPLMLTRDEL